MIKKWKQASAMIFIAMVMMVTIILAPGTAGAANSQEIIPPWAADEIAAWYEQGLIEGDEHGRLLPNQAVKRAEFVTFLNRVFRFIEESQQAFKDVDSKAWYAPQIRKAVAAEIIEGSGNGMIDPLDPVTREQSALILYRLFKLEPYDGAVIPFTDDGDISSWAKEAVYTMKAAGFVEGTLGGKFEPQRALTRAEAIKMINNIMGILIADDDEYEQLKGRNLVVNSSGATLSNIALSGNLYITPGVEEGDLHVTDSQIDGTMFVNGGGVNSITIADSSVNKIIIHKSNGPVRVVIIGSSSVQYVYIYSNGSLIELGDEATIEQFVADGSVVVTGDGIIEVAIINADGVTLATQPNRLVIHVDEVKIGDRIVKKGEETEVPTTPPATGGEQPGGSGDGDGDGDGGVIIVPKKTQIFSHEAVLDKFAATGAEGLVKQYVGFLQDPTYVPANNANTNISMPDFVNAITFVNSDFNIKPSIFPSMRNINTSALDEARTTLWIGTDNGVTRINLRTNEMKNYDLDNEQLADNKVLLLISDGKKGVFAITELGVSHIFE